MPVNSGTVALEKGLRATFFRRRIAMDNPIIDLIATRVRSNGASESYAFMGDVPQMRVWTSEGRKITRLSDVRMTVTNVDYEATIEVDRNTLLDDQVGALPARIRDLAVRGANHPVGLLVAALVSGTTDTGYDGVAFFHDAHPIRGETTSGLGVAATTQDNLLGGTGTSAAQIQTDLSTAIAAMRNFKDEAVEPFTDSVDDLLVVAPPALEANFRTALFASIISQTTNVHVGRADLWITSRLADTDDWYLLNIGNEIKPLLFQERADLSFESDDSNDFMNKLLLYGISARYAASYLLWQYAVKTVNS